MTEPELILWSQLRKGQVGGHKFRRQHPVGPYVVDFACLKANLIVEVDGGHHSTQQKEDRERDANLAASGFTVLRIWNDDVRHNLSGVLDRIAAELQNVDRVEG
ncbi:MAG: endonuclease domain-containing protein [Chloroflexi bacterium]|nr:endonuclease domain-containing protein [Chloroflexota bacterium]